MKLIKPSVEYIPQEDIYKHIELCARTCYKSEDKIAEDSARKFVDGLIKAGHLAMLEHATVYLFFLCSPYDNKLYSHMGEYDCNPYTKGGFIGCDDNEQAEDGNYYDIMGDEASGNMQFCFTTNYRVLVENDWLDDLQYAVTPFDNHWPKRYTMKFICDRGVSHELVRQRKFSFAQESQRYCNYSKDKFDNGVTFIKPSWCDKEAMSVIGDVTTVDTEKSSAEFVLWMLYLADAERAYLKLLEMGWTPQQARSVLPNATKTEIIMTGFEDDWKHFFDLRLRGTTGKPHPDMQYVAQLAWNEFKDKLNLEL